MKPSEPALSAPRLFDRKLLLERRARAARQADLPDFLLRRAADDMAERLQGVQREFARILILGAYDGCLTQAIAAASRGAELVVTAEASAPLLRRCPAPRVQADEELLPFRDGAFDLIASALSLQFVNDLPGALIQIRRALRPDGLFLGAVLGGATLQELREAFMQAELELEGGVSPRVAPMADIRDFGGLLQRAGFALPVADSDLVTVTYASPVALMQDLRAMGAGNMLSERRKTPLRRATLLRTAEIYAERFPAAGGRVRASFEIIHLSGWSPHESQQQPLSPGSAKSRLAGALGVKEHRLKGS
jgi:SAM-dependent methyltransferase